MTESTARTRNDRWIMLVVLLPGLILIAPRLYQHRHELALALPDMLKGALLIAAGFVAWIALAFVAAALVTALRDRFSRR